MAATNRNLEEEVKRGTFRQDLYYRLNVVTVRMSALRERRDDIALLAHHFLQKNQNAAVRKITGISERAKQCLMNHDWPGNVRELENAIERAIVLGNTDEILPKDLPESIAEGGSDGPTEGVKFHETIRLLKTERVQKALRQANQSHSEAARLLGLHPNNRHRLMKSLGLK